jgi:hypothetical protein
MIDVKLQVVFGIHTGVVLWGEYFSAFLSINGEGIINQESRDEAFSAGKTYI